MQFFQPMTTPVLVTQTFFLKDKSKIKDKHNQKISSIFLNIFPKTSTSFNLVIYLLFFELLLLVLL